jgi:hypothetical protein
MKMKNWSICNISEGMESEVKLSPDDIIDSFLNENGVYAGSPLLEFIDIKKLRRSLLNEMDADVPRTVERPAIVQSATAPASLKSTDINQARHDEKGGISITWVVDVPKFDENNPKAKSDVESKVRSRMDEARRQSIYKFCQLYEIGRPNQSYFQAVSNQITFNIGGAPIEKNEKGILDLSSIAPGSQLTFTVDFMPTHPAFKQAWLGMRRIKAQNARNDIEMQQYNADTVAAAQALNQPKPQAPPRGPTFSPNGMPIQQ